MSYYRRGSIVPAVRWPTPTLGHIKQAPYLDYPLVYNETVSLRPFYVEGDFVYCSSDTANTTVHKWNGNSYTVISSYTNPDIISGRGYFAITTAADAYVTITELNPGYN